MKNVELKMELKKVFFITLHISFPACQWAIPRHPATKTGWGNKGPIPTNLINNNSCTISLSIDTKKLLSIPTELPIHREMLREANLVKKRIYLFELFVSSFNKEFLSQVYKLFYVVIISQLVVNNYWFYSYYKLKGKQPNLIRTAVNSLQSTHTMY